MSHQLRKSASFRSRIPVRRNRLSQRRFCSPPPMKSTNFLQSTSIQKTNNKHNNSNNSHPKRNLRNHSLDSSRKRYSSSSFSSSDESCESEAPHRVSIK